MSWPVRGPFRYALSYICSMSKKKITEQVNKDLRSDDDQLVLTALATARQKGNSENMAAIVDLLLHDNNEIKDKARGILFDLKDTAAVAVLMDCFDSSNNKTVRNILLQSLWQSNIQPVNILSRLVNVAIRGSLEESIEIYSVVTNMVDVEIPDSEIMESLLLINNGVENIKDKHQQQLVRDIASFLQEHQEAGG